MIKILLVVIFPIFISCSCELDCGMPEKKAKAIILRCKGEPSNKVNILKPEGPFFCPTEIWQYYKKNGERDDYLFANHRLESSPSQPNDTWFKSNQ